MSEHALRAEMVQIARLMYQQGYISGGEGNLSLRLGPDRILITPSGLPKGLLEPAHLLVVNARGERVDLPNPANMQLKPTSELPMHLEALAQRPDVNAVIHAHPPHAVALSIADVPIADDLVPEVVVFLDRIPVTPYATPSSAENADAIRRVIRDYDALVLQRHGSLTVGSDLRQAFMRLETVESAARIAWLVALLGVERPLSAAQLDKLLQQRVALGLPARRAR